MTTIPIEVSARHVHLRAEDWATLFGSAAMTSGRAISQVPQFVANERVTLAGPKGRIDNVAVVGPFRAYTQAELSMTDAKILGVDPPLSDSGHLEQAVKVTIAGPAGSVDALAGMIQERHIHANTDDAARYGLRDHQEVSVRVDSTRGGVLEHVLVRVDPSYTWRLHLDTDEANAFGVLPGMNAVIIVP